MTDPHDAPETSPAMDTETPSDAGAPQPVPWAGRLAARSVVGGVLMGLANLVPGISGGTMLVASGIYQRFIDAIAEVTTLKFRARSLLVLACVIASAAAAIVLLAGPVKQLVVDYRWVMYAIFIGLTLGGVPVVWGMVGKASRGVILGAVGGFAGMTVLGVLQMLNITGGGETTQGIVVLFFAGALAASAMILPGVSGGYLLLVLGAYVTILGAVDEMKLALKARDWAAMQDPGLQIVLPVGLGVLVGIVLVSNVLKWLLHRFEKPTLGVLLGLLFGAVVGLYPFQRGVEPQLGDTFKGRPVTPDLLAELSPDKWPTEFFTPGAGQVFGAIGLVVAGFAVTCLIARFGKEKATTKDTKITKEPGSGATS
jgi:putative membrane protein